MQNSQIALGMYTVHKSAEENLAGTFKKLADMGYAGIEFYGEPAAYPAKEVAAALSASGLALSGWHTEWRNLQPQTFNATAAYLKEVGCPVAVVPCLGGKWNVNHTPKEESEALWHGYVDALNGIAAKLAACGLRMGYHNHEHEFLLKYGGRTVFDILFEGLGPDVIMELDTGNCIEGGFNPADVLKKYAGRDVILHLKPFSHAAGFDVVLGDAQDENNWRDILAAAPAETLWLTVESENALLPEFENAERCIAGLKKQIEG